MAEFKVPDVAEFETLVAENSFVSDLQLLIEQELVARGVSQAQLASMLNVSEARVSQLLSGNGANLQARTIARIAHALNAKPDICFRGLCDESVSESHRKSFADRLPNK